MPASRTQTGQPLLEQITFNQQYRCFGRGRKLQFRPGVNLLVGDQGCGKSTTLQLIRGLTDRLDADRTRRIITPVLRHACRGLFFDFEKENPRTLSHFLDGEDIRSQVAMMYSSHGESVNAMLRGLNAELAGADAEALILLDEPDMALSPRSAHQLGRIFAEIAGHGHQIIAAVHNPIVIASQPQVYSLEHKRWMKAETFLAKHAEG